MLIYVDLFDRMFNVASYHCPIASPQFDRVVYQWRRTRRARLMRTKSAWACVWRARAQSATGRLYRTSSCVWTRNSSLGQVTRSPRLFTSATTRTCAWRRTATCGASRSRARTGNPLPCARRSTRRRDSYRAWVVEWPRWYSAVVGARDRVVC